MSTVLSDPEQHHHPHTEGQSPARLKDEDRRKGRWKKRGEGRVKKEGLKRDSVSTPRGTKSQNLITVRLDDRIDTFFGYNLNSNLLPQNTLHSFSSEVKQNIHSNGLNQTTIMSCSQKQDHQQDMFVAKYQLLVI